MAAPNPQVQVFHFTSRISSAKIRKYKLATERGMASGSTARTPTPASASAQPTPSPSLDQPSLDRPSLDRPSLDQPSMEPPPKKPRLKLNVRPPSESRSRSQSQSHSQSEAADNITVSRPKRSSTTVRYTEDMNIDDDHTDAVTIQQAPRASPAASSDLSSLSSLPQTEKEPTPAKEAAPASRNLIEDYRKDFMSYYVAGGDDEEEEVEPPQQPPPARPTVGKPATVKQAPPVQLPQRPTVQETKFKHHHVPSSHPTPTPKVQPPRPPPLPPQIHLVEPPTKPSGKKPVETIATMIKKLEVLSTALTNFGGVPAVPKSPKDVNGDSEMPDREAEASPEAVRDDKERRVDDFLAMFDDEDSDDKDNDKNDSGDTGNSSGEGLNEVLTHPGKPDGPLSYGIEFIQNALKSWAHQRLSAQYAQIAAQQMHQQARADAQPQKRGPGRPRKFDSGNEDQPMPTLPPRIRIMLGSTPEGAAIAAFQDVLDSGCLVVNAQLPTELARALRHLYMQIDHLINQGSRVEPPWQCMSYGAQISAQKIRVGKWKEAQAKAQEEMAIQQQIAHQQVMQRMGLPPTSRAREPWSEHQAQQAHAIELERRRSMQHAAQQPHLTRYLTSPLSLDTQTTTMPNGAAPSSVNGVPAKSPGTVPTSATAGVPNGLASQSSPAEVDKVQLDKIKMYTASYLPRSGQSMKFSFAPTNENALRVFGAQAFPAGNNYNSPLPNRGPISNAAIASQLALNAQKNRLPNGMMRTSVEGAKVVPPRESIRSSSETIDVEMGGVERRASQSQIKGDKPVSSIKNGTAAVKEKTLGGVPGSTAVNKPGSMWRSNSMSASLPLEAAVPKQSVGKQNGVPTASAPGTPAIASSASPTGSQDKDIASRFPHPGAIVIDK